MDGGEQKKINLKDLYERKNEYKKKPSIFAMVNYIRRNNEFE